MLSEISKSEAARQSRAELGDILGARMRKAHSEPRFDVSVEIAQLKPSETAVAFLKDFDPDGRHNLVAIAPSGGVLGRTFEPGDWSAMATWIDVHEGQRNLYFSVNEPAVGAPHTKLATENIGAIRAVWADLDPSGDAEDFLSERDRLNNVVEQARRGLAPPSYVNDSGSGFHLFWRLDVRLDAQEWAVTATAQNRGIISALGGDQAVHDLPRIMRLPGTMNIPDARKRAKGRTESRARSLIVTDARYGFDQLASVYPPHARRPDPDIEQKAASEDGDEKAAEISRVMTAIDIQYVTSTAIYDELPSEPRLKFEAARASDAKLETLWRTGSHDKSDPSASNSRFMLAKYLKVHHNALAFTHDEFGALVAVWDHASSGRPIVEWDDYDLRREIARTWVNSDWAETHRRELDPAKWLEVIEDVPASDWTKPTQSSRPISFIPFSEASASALSHSAKPLIKGLLDQGALSVLYGESNVGKTFVAFDIAFHVAAGLPWAGLRTSKFAVVYVAAEGGGGARRRALALRKHYGEETANTAHLHFHMSGVDLRSRGADLDPLIAAVKSIEEPGLMVIDTLSRALAGGDENSSVDMGDLVKNIDRLRHETGAHVMVVHHSGKKEERGARGHSLLRAAIDTEIKVADGQIEVTKQRDMDGSFRRAFSLIPVQLGKDDDGDYVTSCTIGITPYADRPAAVATSAEEEVLNALDALQAEDATAIGFKIERIAAVFAHERKDVRLDALRSRLRELKKKNLVESRGRGLWGAF